MSESEYLYSLEQDYDRAKSKLDSIRDEIADFKQLKGPVKSRALKVIEKIDEILDW